MLSTTYIAIILLASLSVISTIIGVILAFYFKKSVKGIVVGIGFSAGIMLLISFFELVPESIVAAGIFKSSIALFLGALFIYILNLIIPHTHLIKEQGQIDGHLLKVAYLVAFGLILHDFPEGFAMANSYIYKPALGVLIALAIAIHNIPEEFAMAIPLFLTGKKKLLFKAAFLSALAEPIGAILGLVAVSFLPSLNPLFMAFAAGAMVFISIHELLPMAHKYKRTSLFILGIVLSMVVYLLLGVFIPE